MCALFFQLCVLSANIENPTTDSYCVPRKLKGVICSDRKVHVCLALFLYFDTLHTIIVYCGNYF